MNVGRRFFMRNWLAGGPNQHLRICYFAPIPDLRGTRWRSWFRRCATSGKVAGSIPDGVTGIFR